MLELCSWMPGPSSNINRPDTPRISSTRDTHAAAPAHLREPRRQDITYPATRGAPRAQLPSARYQHPQLPSSYQAHTRCVSPRVPRGAARCSLWRDHKPYPALGAPCDSRRSSTATTARPAYGITLLALVLSFGP
jgi:hypothetical protein